MWAPNMDKPAVKMLTHRGPVRSMAIDKGEGSLVVVMSPAVVLLHWITVNRLLFLIFRLLLCVCLRNVMHLTLHFVVFSHPNTQGGHTLVTAGLDSFVNVWDLRTYKQLHSFRSRESTAAIDISARGMLCMGEGHTVSVWPAGNPLCCFLSCGTNTFSSSPFLFFMFLALNPLFCC
jgi:WD40 repeat protein